MSAKLKVVSILFILLLSIIITIFVNKDKISIKYSIVWYLSLLVLLLFIVFPGLIEWFTNLFGIQLASNFVFTMLIALLIVICISLTIIVSTQKEQIRILTQEISIIEAKNEKH